MGIRFVTINKDGDEVWEDESPPGYKNATNNQMELMACILALQGASVRCQQEEFQKIYIFTDSLYVRDHVSRAAYQWSRLSWRNTDGRPVENAELWKTVIREWKKCPRPVDFKWVKGHAKNKHNQAADNLAKASANGVLNPPLKISTVRKKTSEREVEVGSVRMNNQHLDIRIITDERMRIQRVWKYKYEIVSEDSEYHGCVDLIFSKILLRAGHCYRVKVNSDSKNPEILEFIEELKT